MSADGPPRSPFWFRFAVGAFALIGVAYVALMLIFSFGSNVCMIDASTIEPSPSGANIARIEVRTCRNRPTVTEVSLSREQRDFSEVFFSADAKALESGSYAPITVHVAWHGDSELELAYPYALKTTVRLPDAAGVRISYREIPPR